MIATSTKSLTHGSITTHLGRLKQSDPEAIEWFVKRFMPCVVEQARSRMNANGVEDEEDVAQDVLSQFVRQIDRYENLEHRGHLFQILAMLTRRRAIDAFRKAKALQENQESLITNRPVGPGVSMIDPNQASIEILDGLREAIASIKCDDLQTERILEMRLSGYSVREISEKLERGERAIYRLLEKIRNRLSEFGFDPN